MNTFIKRLLTASFLTLILSLLVAPGFRSHIFFLNFVDEDDNIVIGNLAGEGKKLYTDVYTQHQPIMFYLSAGIEKVVKPDNILMTVKRHREFMIVWSFLWIFILIYRFGLPLFFASAVIELMKINLLGNLFLAESFVVYPLIYLISYLVYKNQKKIDWEKDWKDGHYVVAIGYDKNKLYFEDPSSPLRTYLSYDELNKRWHNQQKKEKYFHYAISVYGKKPKFSLNKKVHMG